MIGTAHNLPQRLEAFGLEWQLSKRRRPSSVRLHVRASDCSWPIPAVRRSTRIARRRAAPHLRGRLRIQPVATSAVWRPATAPQTIGFRQFTTTPAAVSNPPEVVDECRSGSPVADRPTSHFYTLSQLQITQAPTSSWSLRSHYPARWRMFPGSAVYLALVRAYTPFVLAIYAYVP